MPLGPVEYLGDDALRVTVPDAQMRDGYAKVLRASGTWREVTPGAASLSVQYDPIAEHPGAAKARLEHALQTPIETARAKAKALIIPVCYEPAYGIDLEQVAAELGCSVGDIIARHTGATYRLDLIGFTPGFAYLAGDTSTLNVPRLKTPRQHVAAGSIGIAGLQCGLYALPGPGGWPVIGRTPFRLFDPSRSDPFVLEAGMGIKFRAIDGAGFESWGEA